MYEYYMYATFWVFFFFSFPVPVTAQPAYASPLIQSLKTSFIQDAVDSIFVKLDSWGLDRQARSSVGSLFGLTGDDAMKVSVPQDLGFRTVLAPPTKDLKILESWNSSISELFDLYKW